MNPVRAGMLFPALVVSLCAVGVCGWSQEEEPSGGETAAQATQAAPPAGATHTVTAGRFKIEVEMSGVFEADRNQTWPVALKPKSWSTFTVLQAVSHGQRVQQGESLVTLDMKEIDEQLADMQRNLRLARLALQLADTDLEMAKTTLPMDLEAAARTRQIADEELNYFLTVNRAFLEESAKESLKSAQQSLEYAQEELKQLEKMYTADDLTEETEEIVLKRARNDVERSQFYLKSAELRARRQLEQELPRQAEQVTDTAKRAGLNLEKKRVTLPVQLEKQQLERDKQALELQRLEEKYQELVADRAMMAVPAPADGYVYYGKASRGKWAGVDTVASQLQEGGKLLPHHVFMTVVALRPLHIRVDVAEKDLHRLARGTTGVATPTGFPDQKLPVAVEEVSAFPIAASTFDGTLRVTLDEQSKALVPGMTCKVALVAYDRADALTVPAAAVFPNTTDGERNVVYVKNAEGKPEARQVTVGQRADQQWEIVAGLNAGDEIFLKKPEGF